MWSFYRFPLECSSESWSVFLSNFVLTLQMRCVNIYLNSSSSFIKTISKRPYRHWGVLFTKNPTSSGLVG